MTAIHKEISLAASPAAIWDVVRDIGTVHTRFAPGFVVDTRMDGADRIVTFANGFVAREVIVDVDEARRRARLLGPLRARQPPQRLVPGAGGRRDKGSRLVWIADVLPEAAAVTRQGDDGGRHPGGEAGAVDAAGGRLELVPSDRYSPA